MDAIIDSLSLHNKTKIFNIIQRNNEFYKIENGSIVFNYCLLSEKSKGEINEVIIRKEIVIDFN